MKLIDLTEDYIDNVCSNNNFDAYHQKCLTLFTHYYQYWSSKIESKVYQKSEIIKSRDLVVSVISNLEKKFRSQKIDISQLTIILFVGMGNTNGHAFRYQDSFAVWIPVETYTNIADAEVFITHEIAHGLHYENSPKFYFESKHELKHIGRQLITEGVATYFSKMILEISNEKALWGNYLDSDSLHSWMQTCDSQFAQINKLVIDNFNNTNDNLEIFYANDREDIYKFRCGYYAGFKLVEGIVKKNNLTLAGLLKLPKDIFEKEILSILHHQ